MHTPVINIPAFVGTNRMPIGVSVVTVRFRAEHLLAIADVLSEYLMTDGGWRIVKD